MNTFSHNKFSHFIFFIFLIWNCSSPKIIELKENSTNVQNLKINKKSFLCSSYKPKTSNGKNIFIYEPIFLQSENLFGYSKNSLEISQIQSPHKSLRKEEYSDEQYSTSSLVPYLLDKGFQIHLLRLETPEEIDTKTSNLAIQNCMELLKKEGVQSLGVLGLSLGGQKIAHYLQTYTESPNIPVIDKIAFLGAGLDYNYTNSLAFKVEKKGILCEPNQKENLCNRLTTSLYMDKNQKVMSYPVLIPRLEMDPKKNFSEITKKKIPILVIYGKLDGTSPEEATIPIFYPDRLEKDFPIKVFEASTANGLKKDYDHFDLFLHESSRKDIFPLLQEWF